MVARVRVPLVFALALGCADFESSVDPSGGAPDELVTNPSFSEHIAPIFDKRCSQGGCHSVATHQAGLVLTPEVAYDSLVNVRATLSAGQLRVKPTKPDSSWLVAMIGPDAAARRNLSRMPLATHPLTDNQIANIVRWIEQGALRN